MYVIRFPAHLGRDSNVGAQLGAHTVHIQGWGCYYDLSRARKLAGVQAGNP